MNMEPQRKHADSLPGENVPQQTGPLGTYLEMEGPVRNLQTNRFTGYGNLEDRLIEEMIHKSNWDPFNNRPAGIEPGDNPADDSRRTSFRYGDKYRTRPRMSYDLDDLRREALERDYEQFGESYGRGGGYPGAPWGWGAHAQEATNEFNEMFPIEDRGWHNVAMDLGYEQGTHEYYKRPEVDRTPYPTAEQFIEATDPESEWRPGAVEGTLRNYATDYIEAPSDYNARKIARKADYTYDYDIKKPGIMGALQRLLPGGKSGRYQGQETLNLLGLDSSDDYDPIINEWYGGGPVGDYSTGDTRRNIGDVVMGTLEGIRGDEGNQISDIVKSLEAINEGGVLGEKQQRRFSQIMGDIQ